MPKLIKIVLISVGVWIITLGAVFTFPHFIPAITGFANLLSLSFGFALLIPAFVSLVKDKGKILSLLTVLLVVVITWLAVTRSVRWGAGLHFQLNRGAYEAKVSKVLSASDEAERRKFCGDECLVMADDRISFHYAHGFLDWYDLIYDPTGAVTEKDFSRRKQINVYLIEARPLSGNWYLGHFGD